MAKKLYLFISVVIEYWMLNGILDPIFQDKYSSMKYSFIFNILFILLIGLTGYSFSKKDFFIGGWLNILLFIMSLASISLMYWKNFLEIALYAVPLIVIELFIITVSSINRYMKK